MFFVLQFQVSSLDNVIFVDQAPFFEAGQIEHRHIHAGGLTVQDDLAHQQAGDWPVHETVARKAGHDIKALQWGCAVDRVRVGRVFV